MRVFWKLTTWPIFFNWLFLPHQSLISPTHLPPGYPSPLDSNSFGSTVTIFLGSQSFYVLLGFLSFQAIFLTVIQPCNVLWSLLQVYVSYLVKIVITISDNFQFSRAVQTFFFRLVDMTFKIFFSTAHFVDAQSYITYYGSDFFFCFKWE